MITSLVTAHCATAHRAPRVWPLRLLHRLFAANALHRQHQALLRLDDAMLSDIGITRFEAESEANRPVWDAPTHWRG